MSIRSHWFKVCCSHSFSFMIFCLFFYSCWKWDIKVPTLKYLFFFVSVRFCFTYFSALLLSMFIIAFSWIETFIIIKCPSVSLVTFFLIFSSYISVPVQFYCGSRLPDVIFHSFTFNLFVLSSRGIHLLIYKGGQSKEI